jgi:glycosyltransferase involved in cell wall biosynthesis
MRVALLINFVAPYRIRLFEEAGRRLGQFRIFVSTTMDADRFWAPDVGTLDVRLQRSFSFKREQRDSQGSRRTLQIHVPYDTLPRLLAYRPDAVISVELGARSVQAALFRLLHPRVALILWCKLSEHTERSFGRVRWMLRRLLVRQADAVMVNGESGARYIMSLGVPDHRIVRLNQPVDVARFAAVPRRRADGEMTRLLCVGTLTVRKGVLPFARCMIDWARRHPRRRLELWWLGDGPLRAELEALDWPETLRPVFCGNLAYDDVPPVYAECDALVFPTLSDEWGLVVNEAMAVGLPVLGSIYSQAVEELVVDDVTGWQFDPHEPASVSAGLDRLLGAPPAVLTAMREAARRRIAPVTPEATAQRIAELVTQLVDGKHASPAAQVGPMGAK